MRNKNRKILIKTFIPFVGFLLIAIGIKTLNSGELDYLNYWRGLVFAPFSIIIGIILIYVGIFKIDKLMKW